MKTPIQELIDSVGWMAQGLDADELYDYFMKEAERMLEKEKEQQRELLLDFCNKKLRYNGVKMLDNEFELVEDYLKSNNCLQHPLTNTKER